MPEQKVKAVIDKKTGKMKVECEGFQGDQCDVIKQIEEHLGVITNTQDTEDRYNYVQPDYLPNQLQG